MSTAIVIQARLSSTRLPGKVLMEVAGAPMLQRMVERVQAVAHRAEIVVATTTAAAEAPIRELCAARSIRCCEGHPTDLLDRHLCAARALGAELVLKVPSDCPLIDPAVIDRVLDLWEQGGHDFVSNLHPPSYPDGNDVEVMPFELLALAAREARRPHEREHTTPFFWDQPERFRIGNVRWETGLDYSMSHRFTVDYPEDYAFVRAVYEQLWSPTGPPFTLADILALCAERPDIFALNARYAGVNWYRDHLDELRTVDASQTRKPTPS